MSKNLLIIGAGTYGVLVKELAASMHCFDKIEFIDDKAVSAADGSSVIGTSEDIKRLSSDFSHAVVALGNPEIRIKLLQKIERETEMETATLISPLAYVSPSAKIGKGCIIEPMAVIHTGCVIGDGCLISAGAVVNHISTLGDAVHVDCNATVAGYMNVPRATKIACGTVFNTAEN